MQVATPSEIYERPNSRWVADFIGEVNLVEGRVADGRGGGVSSDGARHAARRDDAGARPATRSWLALRPEKLRMSAQRPAGDNLNAVAGTVFEIGYRGDMSIYKVRLADRSLMKVALANTARAQRAVRRRRSGVAVVAAGCRRGADGIGEWPRTQKIRPAILAARALVVLVPYLWLAIFFLAPFVIVLKISLSQTALAQPPYVPVLDLRRRLGRA